MTSIHPKKNHSIINIVIAVLIGLVMGGTFSIVALYNNTVNLTHNISVAKAQLDSIGSDNTGLSNAIVAKTGGEAFETLATADGLVQDESPQYFQVNKSWPIASQQ